MADATAAHVTLPPESGETGYGYFWWLMPGGYSAQGIFGQQIMIYPKERLVIAINSAWPRATGRDLWGAQAVFNEAIRAAAK